MRIKLKYFLKASLHIIHNSHIKAYIYQQGLVYHRRDLFIQLFAIQAISLLVDSCLKRSLLE
ncbi:MAG: hypothetical protein ACFFD4_23150 [Candidatus Odinarchaeota archaeon]